MNLRIAVVSSSRADLSILQRLVAKLDIEANFDCSLIATGMHVGNDGPLKEAMPRRIKIDFVGTDLELGAAGAVRSMGGIVSDCSGVFERSNPDLLVVTGDRLDMAPVAMAAVPFNIPIMHLHGGELTYGAVDDRLRHAITKLAHIHCASNDAAAGRIQAMGEEPWRIHVTGAPALDSLMAIPKMSSEEFMAQTGLTDTAGLRLVTVHPETNSTNPLAAAQAVFGALTRGQPRPTIITAPNSDPDSEAIREMIAVFCAQKSWALIKENLGIMLYANAMRHAAVMIGNSSSGLIEAGLFGLPVINVGRRQDGRERGTNVVDVPATEDAILIALGKINRKFASGSTLMPYGDGRAVERILDIIRNLPHRRRLLAKFWHEQADTCAMLNLG